MPFHIYQAESRSILSPVSGFLAQAGFTHSLTPARNCTFGCSYCYVPTMRVQGGLRPDDWQHWGEWTTFKTNASRLLRRELRSHQAIYCSPLTDPYQPAEAEQKIMPAILSAVIDAPPRGFVLQTRGPLVLRDVDLLLRIPGLRVSFSITTNREDMRRKFEPLCAQLQERFEAVRALTAAGIATSVAIAPTLPCDPEELVGVACEVSNGPVIADPFHVRPVKRTGALTRAPALATCDRYEWNEWLDPVFQREILRRMESAAARHNRAFGHGPAGFGLLAPAPAPSGLGELPDPRCRGVEPGRNL